MKKCFTCGVGFNGSVKELLQLFKLEKRNYFFYQLKPKGDVFIVSAKDFEKILQTKLKGKNGKILKSVNYAHVSEFTPK